MVPELLSFNAFSVLVASREAQASLTDAQTRCINDVGLTSGLIHIDPELRETARHERILD